MPDLPKGPCLRLSMYFCSHLSSGDYLLVTNDEYSRYPIVEIFRKTSRCYNTSHWKNVSLFSYPAIIKTDNGPQFKSNQWREFLKSWAKWGFKPWHPYSSCPLNNCEQFKFKVIYRLIRCILIHQRQKWITYGALSRFVDLRIEHHRFL